MCGIAGLMNRTNRAEDGLLEATVRRMVETLHHRGPDDTGIWSDARAGVALGHKRLSIIDLSEQGHQPMSSACSRYSIVFNGEVYNHAQLRRELKADGRCFRGHSDTEALLRAVAEWGIQRAVERSIGMFAFAVWDAQEQRLTLVRDRLGIKPLYYGWMGNTFLFGSELKALRAFPGFRGEIERKAVSLFLQHNYIPAPFSIYKGVYKLPAGSMLSITPATQPGDARPTTYWSMRDVAERGAGQPFRGTVEEAVTELDRVLNEAVRIRMEADVPLGAFLSGGIDSSTVVALMQANSSRPVRTFSIGFEEPAYNEAEYARAVAEHLGTEHVDCYVTPQQARDVIPRLPTLYDEPFADSSQIPTFLVSQLARQHVTVSLSGDGGDELFGGYDRYSHIEGIWRKVGWAPAALRRTAAAVLGRLSPRHPSTRLGRRMRTLAEVLAAPDRRGFYTWLHTHWRDPGGVVIGGSVPATLFTGDGNGKGDRSNLPERPEGCFAQIGPVPFSVPFREQMMYIDSVTYLPDDILVKVDRASMGVGLEARVPVLDHRVVEFAWSLPPAMKFHGGEGKWLLRQVLGRYVPRELVERPKVGFGVPMDSWLRGSLRDWAEDLLDARRLKDEGFFRPEPIRKKWDEHLAGTCEWHYLLWDVLMFQAWLASMAASCISTNSPTEKQT